VLCPVFGFPIPVFKTQPMKNFQDNLDQDLINKPTADQPSRKGSLLKRSLRSLQKFSLLWVLGLATIAIMLLLWQGRSWLQQLPGTPLPVFWLEGSPSPKKLPDKTKVYEQSLAQQARQRWQQRSAQVTASPWSINYRQVEDTAQQVQDIVGTLPDSSAVQVVERQQNVQEQSLRRKPRRVASRKQQTNQVKPSTDTLVTGLFQTIHAAAPAVADAFVACVVHGDQQIGNQDRLTLRLTEAMQIGEQTFPAGTLVYGSVRFSQNKLALVISRLGTAGVNLIVYDHTFHAGILLEENPAPLQEAGKETLLQQGSRRVNQLPSQIASDLGRNLLRRTRRRPASFFLPDR